MAYSDQIKANTLALLAANNGEYSETARQAGLPIKTVWNWAQGKDGAGRLKEMVKVKTEELGEMFEDLARSILYAVTPDDIACANLQQKITAAAIGFDKGRIARGEPTNISQQYQDPNNRNRRLTELLQRHSKNAIEAEVIPPDNNPEETAETEGKEGTDEIETG